MKAKHVPDKTSGLPFKAFLLTKKQQPKKTEKSTDTFRKLKFLTKEIERNVANSGLARLRGSFGLERNYFKGNFGFCPRAPVHRNRYKRPNNVQQLNKGS